MLTPTQRTQIQSNLFLRPEMKEKLIRSWDALSLERQNAIVRLLDLSDHMFRAVLTKCAKKDPTFFGKFKTFLEQQKTKLFKIRERVSQKRDQEHIAQLEKEIAAL